MPRNIYVSAMMLAALSFFVAPVRSESAANAALSETPAAAVAEAAPPIPVPAPVTVTETAPAEAVKSAETPKLVETPKAAPDADAKVKKSVGCAAELEELVTFHRKEIVSLNKMIARWNGRLQGYINRRTEIDQEIASLTKEMQAADPNRNKKEISRLSKQINRLGKDRAGVEKDLRKQCGELAGELKEMSRETASALRERYQQVQKTIETH